MRELMAAQSETQKTAPTHRIILYDEAKRVSGW